MEKKFSETLAREITAFTGEGPIRLMFQDEARFGRISDVRRCWCPKPHRPMVQAMVSQEYTYAYTALTPVDGRMDSLVLPQVNGVCMDIFLTEIASRYPEERIIMVLDGAGWHKNQKIPLPSNLRLVFLPPYAPELNPVEHLWDDLREKFFHNRVFVSIEALEDHLVSALLAFENDTDKVQSITGWDWIINAL